MPQLLPYTQIPADQRFVPFFCCIPRILIIVILNKINIPFPCEVHFYFLSLLCSHSMLSPLCSVWDGSIPLASVSLYHRLTYSTIKHLKRAFGSSSAVLPNALNIIAYNSLPVEADSLHFLLLRRKVTVHDLLPVFPGQGGKESGISRDAHYQIRFAGRVCVGPPDLLLCNAV